MTNLINIIFQSRKTTIRNFFERRGAVLPKKTEAVEAQLRVQEHCELNVHTVHGTQEISRRNRSDRKPLQGGDRRIGKSEYATPRRNRELGGKSASSHREAGAAQRVLNGNPEAVPEVHQLRSASHADAGGILVERREDDAVRINQRGREVQQEGARRVPRARYGLEVRLRGVGKPKDIHASSGLSQLQKRTVPTALVQRLQRLYASFLLQQQAVRCRRFPQHGLAEHHDFPQQSAMEQGRGELDDHSEGVR